MIKLLYIILVLLWSTPVFAATEVVYNGTTWAFNADYTTGHYANGDPWVLDPGSGVVINSTLPVSTTGNSAINGSMINPNHNLQLQGYDPRIYWNSGWPWVTYDATLNVTLDISSGSPLTLNGGESLVSTISRTATGTNDDYSFVANLSVLTCVDVEPASGAFRPPFVGTDKVSYFNESDIDYSVLKNLSPTVTPTDLSTTTASFQYTQYDVGGSGGQWRSMRPTTQMENYGASISQANSQALLTLHLDYTNSEKRDLLVSMLQYAIDINALISNSGGSYCGVWVADGGHGLGRRGVLALGAMVFDNAAMKSRVSAVSTWAEDLHVWEITSADYARTVCGYDGSRCADSTIQYTEIAYPIGTPEFGFQHATVMSRDNANMDASYRSSYGGQLGGLMATILVGAESLTGDIPYDYMERIRPEMGEDCSMSTYCAYSSSLWELSVFDDYWDTYRDAVTPSATTTLYPFGSGTTIYGPAE